MKFPSRVNAQRYVQLLIGVFHIFNNCNSKFTLMTYTNIIDEARDSYSLEWEMTSNFFNDKGFYDWCAKHIKENSRVLEIGVGIGNSSLSLLYRKCKIIGVEENKFNIEKAINLFRRNKIYCGKIIRENAIEIKNGNYFIEYLPMDEVPAEFINKNDIVIIQGDFILDEYLNIWLSQYQKYDAIICWFTGVHGIIYNHSLHTVENPTEYRILLHDFLFEFGPKLLNSDGVINLCDRFSQIDSQTQQTLINEMKQVYKFEERNLEIKSTDQIIVDGFDTPYGIQHDKLETNISGGVKALYSISIGLKQTNNCT